MQTIQRFRISDSRIHKLGYGVDNRRTPMINRRTFLTAASGLALTARVARASVQGANNRIRIGIIGTGGRARGVMNLLKRLPGHEMVAICDVYEPRLPP